MRIEEHEEAYNEHLNHLKLDIEKGVKENQRNIGYNASQGSVELFSIFLHKLNLIGSSGEMFDHRIFKNKRLINKRIFSNFPNKTNILEIMRKIEENRNILCYGKRRSPEEIKKVITLFNNLREIINKELKNGRKK